MPDLKRRLAAYFRVVIGRKYAGRGLTVYPDDTFLVSFPRSGNTWTRFLVCNLIDPYHPVTFTNLEIPPVPPTFPLNIRQNVQTAIVGINYRFRSGAVVANY